MDSSRVVDHARAQSPPSPVVCSVVVNEFETDQTYNGVNIFLNLYEIKKNTSVT
jgi:hypothetical protein